MVKLIQFLLIILLLTLAGCAGNITLKPMQVPCPPISVLNPAWSPDGTLLAYTLENEQQEAELHIANLTSGQTTTLTDVPHDSLAPEWTSDGSRLLLGKKIPNSSLDVGLFTVDTENGAEFSFFTIVTGHPFYKWSPDGNQIALVDVEPEADLLVLDHKGVMQWRLSELHPDISAGWDVDWSPDGTQLAFGLTGIGNLAIVDLNGNISYGHIPDIGQIWDVEWSPDGKKIALISIEYSTAQAFLSTIDAQTMTGSVIVPDPTVTFQWLPDSSGIIYVSANRQIVTVTAQGTNRKILPVVPDVTGAGPFSPDAKKIILAGTGQLDRGDLYVMNVDGSNHQTLFHNPGNDKCFQWPF